MAEIELAPADAGLTRTAAEGDVVIVALEETPTSGYRWAVDSFDPEVLVAAGDTFTPPDPGRLGGSGRHEFRFRVIGPGSTPIRIVLARAWDPGSTAQAFAATIEASATAEPGAGPSPDRDDPPSNPAG